MRSGGLSLSFLFVASLGVGIAGCDKAEQAPIVKEQLAPVDTGSALSQSVAASDVTREEAEAMAQEWAIALSTGDLDSTTRLFDWVDLAKRCLDPLNPSSDVRKGLMSGAKSWPQDIGGQISSQLSQGGSYRLVKVLTRGGEKHAIFRLILPEGGLNYHDIRISKRGNTLTMDRLFVAMSGEEMADTLRSLLAPAVLSQQSVTGRLSGAAKKERSELQLVAEMSAAMRAGDTAKALAVYERMSPSSQKKKPVQLQRIMSLSDGDQDDYVKAIGEYRAAFPGDPSLALVSLDAAVVARDTEQLLALAKDLALWTGGDRYMDVLIGATLCEFGEIEKGLELAKGVDLTKLDLASGYDYRVAIDLAVGDHDSVLRNMKILRDKYNIKFGDLKNAKGFEGFVESPQYKHWVAD